MTKQIDCPICDGTGLLENNKGIEFVCSTCEGRGKINEPENSKTKESEKSEEL